jgi:hypothetical protein
MYSLCSPFELVTGYKDKEASAPERGNHVRRNASHAPALPRGSDQSARFVSCSSIHPLLCPASIGLMEGRYQ